MAPLPSYIDANGAWGRVDLEQVLPSSDIINSSDDGTMRIQVPSTTYASEVWNQFVFLVLVSLSNIGSYAPEALRATVQRTTQTSLAGGAELSRVVLTSQPNLFHDGYYCIRSDATRNNISAERRRQSNNVEHTAWPERTHFAPFGVAPFARFGSASQSPFYQR